MSFNNLLNRFFGRDDNETSKNVAKERLRLVLVHDRLDFTEQEMNSLREDLISVIGKYFGIDEKALEVSLTRETEGMALVANIPILGPKRKAAKAEPPAADKPAAPAKDKAAPAKQTAPVKDEPAATKQAAPVKDEPAPAKTAPAADKQGGAKQGGGKKNGQPKQALPKKQNPEQAVEAYIK